ncbi:MAG: hypothetical protein A3F68_01615 [Acidobacteria bacterium RIFCSPLOWO2_12_FULL_54_10]|nr:MAG: hypothetical protein A3F68_01615 [Acidobacteria bacterium RIFCSPLOWO2_12_FULL_54_10]
MQLASFPAKDQDKLATALVVMETDPFLGDIIKLGARGTNGGDALAATESFFAADRATRTVSINAIVRRTSTTY